LTFEDYNPLKAIYSRIEIHGYRKLIIWKRRTASSMPGNSNGIPNTNYMFRSLSILPILKPG